MQKDNSFIDWCKSNNKDSLIEEYMSSNLISVDEITYGSNKKALWKCLLCGNEWEAKIANRTILNRGCPVCGKRKASSNARASRALKNNLLENHPELSIEWDYERNALQPQDYACGSDYKAYWICSWCGEKWQAQIKKRALRGDGCPRCKKQSTSFQEQALLYYCKKSFNDVIGGAILIRKN